MIINGKLLGYTFEEHDNKEGAHIKSTQAYIETKVDKIRGSQILTIVGFTNKADKFLTDLDAVGAGKNITISAYYYKGSSVYDDYIVVNK